jgi:hypothetical protein
MSPRSTALLLRVGGGGDRIIRPLKCLTSILIKARDTLPCAPRDEPCRVTLCSMMLYRRNVPRGWLCSLIWSMMARRMPTFVLQASTTWRERQPLKEKKTGYFHFQKCQSRKGIHKYTVADPRYLSRIPIFIRPGSQILDPGSNNKNKKKRGKEHCWLSFLLAKNFTKLKIIFILNRYRKKFEPVDKDIYYITLYPNNCQK